MEKTKQDLSNYLFNIKNGLPKFKRDTYKDFFMEVYNANEDVLKRIENFYSQSDDKEALVQELADAFVDEAGKRYDALQKKSAKEQFLLDNNTIMVVYVLPGILYYKGASSVPLSDAILKRWNERFTKYHIGCGTFDEIKSGFKTKLCYITTAVCESLGKEDDCYELKMLRDYRDNYLAMQAGGKELIEQYYDIAPTIVNRINKCDDAKDIYRNIYVTYLSPCISTIEKEDNKTCKTIYINMMEQLQKKYLGSRS